MDKNSLFDQIIMQVANGHNIMCCFPRRSGKTHLASMLIKESLVGKNIVHLTVQKALSEELIRRVGHKIENMTFRSLNRLRGRNNIDCIIVEEPYKVKVEQFNEAMMMVKELGCQVVFLFSPFEYDSRQPHPLKVLWDTAPWFKYQISAGLLDHYNNPNLRKSDYRPQDWHSEIEGNWVAI